MRILLIDVNCKYSSTGKIVYDLYQNLNKKHCEMAIAYGRGTVVKEKNIYKFGLDFETKIHALLARLTGYNGCFSPISTWRLLQFVKKFQPDIIHIHELHAYFVNIKPLLKYIKNKKIKVVWTFHCEYMYTGKCGYAYDCEKWKDECGKCPAVRQYPKSILLDQTKSMFQMKKDLLKELDMMIITPSQWLAERVNQSFLHGKKIDVIHNGIDTETIFYPRHSSMRDLRKEYGLNGKKIVLAVAPNILDERKGGAHVLEISERFSPDVVFVLIGAEKSVWYSTNVLMLQRTKNQDELAEWYSTADLFLICSKKENFPTTCLEALSCGTPVVGFDTGGTKETAPGDLGTFVEYMDYQSLEKSINDYLQKPRDKQTVREKAVRLYAKEVMCNKYLDIYEKMVKKETV